MSSNKSRSDTPAGRRPEDKPSKPFDCSNIIKTPKSPKTPKNSTLKAPSPSRRPESAKEQDVGNVIGSPPRLGGPGSRDSTSSRGANPTSPKRDDERRSDRDKKSPPRGRDTDRSRHRTGIQPRNETPAPRYTREGKSPQSRYDVPKFADEEPLADRHSPPRQHREETRAPQDEDPVQQTAFAARVRNQISSMAPPRGPPRKSPARKSPPRTETRAAPASRFGNLLSGRNKEEEEEEEGTDEYEEFQENASQAESETGDYDQGWTRKGTSWLSQLIIRSMGVLVVSAIVFFVWNEWKDKPYCDSIGFNNKNLDEECTSCPRNGRCEGGRLTCDPSYVEQSGFCVKDERVIERAKVWALALEEHLAYLDGSARCWHGHNTMDEHGIRKYLGERFGEKHLEETWQQIKLSLPTSIMRQGTLFSSRRTLVPILCKFQRAFWTTVPPLLLFLTMLTFAHYLWERRKRDKEAYKHIMQFVEYESVTAPRLRGPTCADVTDFGTKELHLPEPYVRKLLTRIVKQEPSIQSSPDVYRGNATMYYSTRAARNIGCHPGLKPPSLI